MDVVRAAARHLGRTCIAGSENVTWVLCIARSAICMPCLVLLVLNCEVIAYRYSEVLLRSSSLVNTVMPTLQKASSEANPALTFHDLASLQVFHCLVCMHAGSC